MADDEMVAWLSGVLDLLATRAGQAANIGDPPRIDVVGAEWYDHDAESIHEFVGFSARSVLARVEAERAIVTEYVEQVAYHGDPKGKTAAFAAVRLLAYGHRFDAPGYRDEWSPDV